ncbi:AmmeMemoRadiSam system protein A [bacterium]|nr:AmmeMemoRadiSam system protein A [bacterium]
MNPFIELAKKAVENYIKKGEIIDVPDNLPREILEKKSGTFVTIKKSGQLRGCIGTYLPTRENIAEEIIRNAIAAATQDYRFDAVQKEELPYLSYTVYILDKPEQIKDISELDPKKYGILIKTLDFPPKSALLLPDLEGLDTVEKQLFAACQKAGINPEKEKIVIYKFSAKKYGK